MMAKRTKLLGIAASVAMWATVQPGTLSAQTSGVGGDGFTRLFWQNTDYQISLWKLDSNLNATAFQEYGPVPGWIPIAITTAPDNNTYVLWRNIDGRISLWLIDANLRFVTFREYGPFIGWIAKGLSVSGNVGGSQTANSIASGTNSNANVIQINQNARSSNEFRVIWTSTDGKVWVWKVDPNLNAIAAHEYGPFPGWDPG
jgi:hypothetical protein